MSNSSNLSRRILNIQKSAIHEMTRLSKQFEDVAFLSWAKPTSGAPEFIRAAAIDAIKKGLVDGYSESLGILDLRKEIAKKVKSYNKIDATPQEILVTVGAVEGLAAGIVASIDPGDEVILPDPTYSTHIQQVVLASGKPILVPLVEEEEFKFNTDEIRKRITSKTKAIMYCSPTNPTGTVFTEKQLRKLADLALEHNLMVITDEAYEYFTYDGFKHFSIGSIEEMRNRTISCFTFTKSYAMTGWRIGYLHAHEDLIPHLNKAHIPFAICAPVISQYAALGALKGPQNCISEFRSHYLEARNLMCERLDELSAFLSYQKPRGSYLMFPKILINEGKDSVTFCKRLLREVKVSTTPGIAFGPSGENHMRLSFCVPLDMINKAFDRIDIFFNGISS